MANSLANRSRDTLGERFAHVSPARQAHAALRERVEPEADTTDPAIFECIEATQRKFKHSDKEMAGFLRITQANYARRKYNGARVQFLDLDRRRYFVHCFAKTVGLRAEAPTPTEELKSAAKVAISTLLDLMEAK